MDSRPDLPPPPSAAPAPDGDDALGRRIGAAVLDLILMVGLFVVLALTIGEHEKTETSAYIYLRGADAMIYLALILLYHFAMESVWGKTVGKFAFGVAVRSQTGDRATVGAITIRTLVRVVDWLPFLYLVGFISMLATGRRRLRLGDLAAKTLVVRH